MPEKKKKEQPDFTVTDRRLFTTEGERRDDAPSAQEAGPAPEPPEPQASPQPSPQPPVAEPTPDSAAASQQPPPSDAEQQAQHTAYQDAARKIDEKLQEQMGSGGLQDMEMTFERFVASIYMTALMQLGLIHEEGQQPRADLIGARQTIDTLGILSEKTRGNLSDPEKNLLQNCLYELRMAYLEITNAITRGPQPGPGGPPLS
jgi:hypothetical protein